MDGQPFIALATGGIQPEPYLSPLSASLTGGNLQQESNITSSLYLPTHNSSCTKYPIDELETFAARLENTAASIFPNKGRSRYDDVRVLLLRWQVDTMGVQYEVEDLAKVFESAYGFGTETWLIPTARSHFALMGKVLQMVEEFGKANNLLVVYYAGHGVMNSSRQAVWTCKADVNYASLQWYAIQTLLEQAEADVLLLLDCCAAASGAPAAGDSASVTEMIAACGFETWAPQPGRHSFTNTLIAVLEDWQNSPAFTAGMLHCEVLNRLRHEKPEPYRNMKNFEFRKSPIHIISTSDPKARSVELGHRNSPGLAPNAQLTRPKALQGKDIANSKINRRARATSEPTRSLPNSPLPSRTDDSIAILTEAMQNAAPPQVQITLALEEDQELDFEKCRRWLQDFPGSAKYAQVQGTCKKKLKRRSDDDVRFNVYTQCGRHSDDWLFGGFSVAGVAKNIWKKGDKGGVW